MIDVGNAAQSRMVVSDPLAPFEHDGMVKVVSPAKVNLFLGIGARRFDGYHEAESVMHSLSLHDTVHIDRRASDTGQGLHVDVAMYARGNTAPLEIASEDNIAYKAVMSVAEKLGRDNSETVSISIEKRIPHQAGMGGGSSNAAAVLVGIAALWGIDPHTPEIMSTAHDIGTDVTFFLHGGCACLTGVGDEFSRELIPMKKNVIVVKPEAGVATIEAYRAFDKAPVSIPEDIRVAVSTAQRADDVPLFNGLTQAAESIVPAIAEIRAMLDNIPGVEGSLVSGSGSAVFGICDTFTTACAAQAAARRCGWWATTTTFSSLKAAIIPSIHS